MFYYLDGTVAEIAPFLAVIDCGGVGYACKTTNYTLSRLKKGQKGRLYTHLNVGEGIFELYGFATQADVDTIKAMAFKVNDVLKEYFASIGVELIDFKLEFGKTADGQIVLADEISPDTCRFWDIKTHEKLDKDRFRRDLGGVEDAYKEMMKRVGLD